MGLGPAVVEEAVRVYRASYDLLSSPLYDGVPELLGALRAAGLPLALATSKPQPFAELVVEGTGLAGLLDVVAGSDLASGPSTRPTSSRSPWTCSADLPPRSWWATASYDVLGAAAHGVPCVGVLWGYGDEQELLDAGAVAVVGTPAELATLLTGS